MRNPSILSLLLALHAAPSAAAPLSPACEAKRTRIETQIAEATARGNKQELAGLNRALRATTANCTDASLAKERDARIRKAEKEIAEREKDLAQAQKSGDADKVEKRREKLEEARRELVEAQKPVTP
ncbi:DUF1090 domain-containing protein [Uliginosibacterium sp. H1]|uniref:DUF1090 domain-containing protein n=1 Tax=Uliginosibacterium sp. H1 TaxID=3114757 RepID=UPI002E19FD14|nr:DUF1090 domain-containing protein [Uliginosibacterium sp. H1]